LNPSLENSPNSALEFGEFSKLILVLKKNMFFGILFLLNLSSGKSPNSTSECVYFLNFDFFFEKNEFGDFEPEFGENLQTQKKNACEGFFGNKICVQRVFFVSKKSFARIFFFEFGYFLQTQVQNLQTHFFEKKIEI